MITIHFEVENGYGVYIDALHLSAANTLIEEHLTKLKQSHARSWVKYLDHASIIEV